MSRPRFAALGDSLTVGIGDPVPGGWRGWAALLARGLTDAPGGAALLNCAASGAQTADVAGGQLRRARDFGPHLAAVVVGANDTLRGSFDIAAVAARLEAVLAALTGDGAVVLTACLPDPGRMLGLPWPLARPLGRRMRALNHVVHVLSERHQAVHLHASGHPWIEERAAWSVDRLHPSELGHRLLAREFHGLLRGHGLATGPVPAATPDGPAPGRAASAWWMATQGTGWVRARCTDLLPDLLRLAVTEVRHRAPAASALLDQQAHATAVAALAPFAASPAAGHPRPGAPAGALGGAPAGGAGQPVPSEAC